LGISTYEKMRGKGRFDSQWKERFKIGCLQKARDIRRDRINSCRFNKNVELPDMHIDEEQINSIFREEMDKFKSEERDDLDDDFLTPSEREDILIYIYETINQEKNEEEQRISNEYEESIRLQNEEENERYNAALCPICRTRKLLQHQSIIFCNCGIRIDTKMDHFNMAQIQEILLGVTTDHSESGCTLEPNFEIRNVDFFDLSNSLWMTCSGCNMLRLVI